MKNAGMEIGTTAPAFILKIRLLSDPDHRVMEAATDTAIYIYNRTRHKTCARPGKKRYNICNFSRHSYPAQRVIRAQSIQALRITGKTSTQHRCISSGWHHRIDTDIRSQFYTQRTCQ